MHISNRTFYIASLVGLVLVTVVGAIAGWPLSVVVMLDIAVVAFMTVVAVISIGSVTDDHTPQTPSESAAVTAWQERLSEKERALAAQQQASANPSE